MTAMTEPVITFFTDLFYCGGEFSGLLVHGSHPDHLHGPHSHQYTDPDDPLPLYGKSSRAGFPASAAQIYVDSFFWCIASM